MRLECPQCHKNIVVNLQSEVYLEEPRLPMGPRHPMLHQIRESGTKVTITLKDGREIDVANPEELAAVFRAIERERLSDPSLDFQTMTDIQLDAAHR